MGHDCWTHRFLLHFIFFWSIIPFSELFLGHPCRQFLLRWRTASRQVVPSGEHNPPGRSNRTHTGCSLPAAPIVSSLRLPFTFRSSVVSSPPSIVLFHPLRRGTYPGSGLASHNSSMSVVLGLFARLVGPGLPEYPDARFSGPHC
jgi:hypothetical protein